MDLLALRGELVKQWEGPLPNVCFLPDTYDLDVMTTREKCEHCEHVKLLKQRTVVRHPVGIHIGSPALHHHIKKCPNCKQEYVYENLNQLIPPHSKYCYDLIVEIGIGRFQNNRQNQEIQQDLLNRYGLFIPQSTINDLSHRFLDFFVAVHQGKADAIRQMINHQGGYVAHFDGTCEAGTDIIFTIIDELSGLVLSSTRMVTENTNDISKMFEKCKESFGSPLATMRDLSRNIATSRNAIFSDVPDLICQYHFLENVGKALFKETHRKLTTLMRKLKIQPKLKSLRNGLVKRNKMNFNISEHEIKAFLKEPTLGMNLDQKQLCKHLTFYILRWLDDYSSELKGEHFPFDQPSLIFYRRCVHVYNSLKQKLINTNSYKGLEKQTLNNIQKALECVICDESLVEVANRLIKGVELFQELRELLQFKRADGKPVLRDRPPQTCMNNDKHISGMLATFYRNLEKTVNDDRTDTDVARHSATIIKYLDKYKSNLVGHTVTLQGKNRTRQIDRTNNLSEHSFAKIKKGWRRKLGTKKLTRQLQAARHEEFLVTNLKNHKYIATVYEGDLANMSSHFAKYHIEALIIRKSRVTPQENQAMQLSKKTIRVPENLPRVFTAIRSLLIT